MKKLFIFLACVMLPVLSYAQEQNGCDNDNQQVVEGEVSKMYRASDWDSQSMPPMSLMPDAEERPDSVSWYEYNAVAHPLSILDEVDGMCERKTPMGIFIMMFASVSLFLIGIAIIVSLVKLVIRSFPIKKK